MLRFPSIQFYPFNNEVGQTIYAIGIFSVLMDVSLSKLQEMVKEGKPGVLQSMGSQRVGLDWGTEQQQLETHHGFREVPGEKMK